MKFESTEYNKNLFLTKILPKTKNIFPNIEDLLTDWTIFIGQNPLKFNISAYCILETKSMYLNPNNLDILPNIDFDNIALMTWFYHEIGHVIHNKYLGMDKVKWEEWARETGHSLDLTPKSQTCIPSWEEFSKDIYKIITEGVIIPYYFKLIGLKVVELECKTIENEVYIPLTFIENDLEMFVDKIEFPKVKIVI